MRAGRKKPLAGFLGLLAMAREPTYGADVLEVVLARLRQGETLRAICRDEGCQITNGVGVGPG